MSNQPVGLPYQNPTTYVGPDQNIVPIKRFPREPLTTDKKFRIGQVAIIGNNPSTGTEGELWYLARFESNGDASWFQFDTGTPGIGIDSLLTDDGAPPIGPTLGGVVSVFGGAGIITSGQDPATTVTIGLDGSVVGQTITGDAGGALSPTAGNWNIVGGTGLDTSGAGSTLTINMDGSVVTSQYDGDSGSATPTAGVLNIIGGNGTVTSAAGNTVTVEMQSPFTGDFAFTRDSNDTTLEIETTTANDPILLFTADGATSFNYRLDRGNTFFQLRQSTTVIHQVTTAGETTQPLQPAFLAVGTATSVGATGDGTVFTCVFNSEIFDQNSDFATNTFTAPITGRYRLSFNIFFDTIMAGHTSGSGQIVTSNRTYLMQRDSPATTQDSNNQREYVGTVLCDMDAADTATITLTVLNSTKVINYQGTSSFFHGELCC